MTTPTCAKPDGTPWCKHCTVYDETFTLEAGATLESTSYNCMLHLDYTEPDHSCGAWEEASM